MHHPGVSSVAALKAAVPPRYKQAARRLFLRLSVVTSAGTGVECPCCGREARHFVRFHGEHDQCAGCGSLMRHRALLLLLRDRLRFDELGGRLIHIGPGPSVGAWLASRDSIDYVSVDLYSPLAHVQADMCDLPFEDESFDMAVCVHTLEHIPDDRLALRELHRVLRPGGLAVVQVPPSNLAETREDPSVTDPQERERLFGQYDHVRLCGADYPDRMRETGFDVERIDYVDELALETRRRFGLRTGEPFDVCIRR